MTEPEIVTIPLAEYRDLLKCRRLLAEAGFRRRSFEKPARSMIERDPEVAVFIANRLGTWPATEIRDLCARAFGPVRTPSVKSIYRYWDRLKASQKSP